MRRLTLLISVVAVILAGSLASSRMNPGTAAQDATPAAEVALALLGHGLPTAAPGYDLSFARATFPPGAAVPAHTHPGASIVYVESGSMGFTLLQGEAWLTRAGAAATPGAQGESLAVDTEVVLTAGDALFFPAEHGDSARNAGDGPLVISLANLYTVGEPPLTLVGTPTS